MAKLIWAQRENETLVSQCFTTEKLMFVIEPIEFDALSRDIRLTLAAKGEDGLVQVSDMVEIDSFAWEVEGIFGAMIVAEKYYEVCMEQMED